jgi:high-affinity nickel permease
LHCIAAAAAAAADVQGLTSRRVSSCASYMPTHSAFTSIGHKLLWLLCCIAHAIVLRIAASQLTMMHERRALMQTESAAAQMSTIAICCC